MDLSKVPDDQRQELEKLQKQFQEHQAEQQKQQQQQQQQSAAAASAAAAVQQPPPPSYDPSQAYDPAQAYDQSYYYNYNYQDPSQQQQQQPQQQYDPSYYQNYYPNAYQQPPPQYTHPETTSAPAYPAPTEQQRNEGSGTGSLGLGHVQVQGPYVAPNNQINLDGTQPNPGHPVPPGLNAAAAAAVAALSQLTQFAGSMGAAERAVGGGGYGPPMTGGGHYGQGHFRPPFGHSPYRGGGRRGGGSFRGGGRGNFGFRPPSYGGLRGRGRGRGRGGGGGGRHDQSSQSQPQPQLQPQPQPSLPEASAAAAAEAAKPSEGSEPIRIAWCELCRVDCNSKEILEQHKMGKRHKKNEQSLQDMKGPHQPAGEETQKDENGLTDTGSEKVGTDENKVETKTEEMGEQEKKPWLKRKMRGGARGGGRGGKRQRQGPSKPKIVIPLMCDLCNVKCDTQEVFDRHVGGKKHIAKVKRFEGHQAMYGPTAVQALYPPNPLSQTMTSQPGYYGAPTSTSNPDAASYIGPTHETQNPNPQLADAPLEFGTQNAPSEPPVATGETHVGNGVSA